MNSLEYLIIHSTGTPKGFEIAMIDYDWEGVGFSDLVRINGQIDNLTPFNISGESSPWENIRKARHIAYVGGASSDGYNAEDTRTNEQKETLEVYIKYMIRRHPNLKVAGYNQFKDTSDPSFDVAKWLKGIKVDSKNIY